MALFYTNNEVSERQTKNKITFTITCTKMKYLGINLTMEVKDLYFANYTTLKKETKGDTNKRRHIVCSLIGKISIIKMFILGRHNIVEE